MQRNAFLADIWLKFSAFEKINYKRDILKVARNKHGSTVEIKGDKAQVNLTIFSRVFIRSTKNER